MHAGNEESAAAHGLRRVKETEDWQLARWAVWPTEADWPGVLDVFEAAAFLRVHPSTIRAATKPNVGTGRVILPCQRIGGALRFRKTDLLEQRCTSDAK
jgi:hypothetical protein